MKKYKAIIFDFDNTLFDGTTWFVDFIREFLKKTPYSNWNYRDFYNELNTQSGTSGKIDKKTSDAYWAGLRKATNFKPFPEDEDAISLLHKMGIKLGICSRSVRAKIEGLLKDFHMEDFFEVIVDKAQKPNPKFLLDVLNQLGIKPSEVLYVGDEDEDIEIGRNVGTDTAYLLRAHAHFQETYRLQREKIEQLYPTYRISSLLELLKIVRS